MNVYEQHWPEPIRTASDRVLEIRGHESCPENFAHRGRTHDAQRVVASSSLCPPSLAGEDHSLGGRRSNESGDRPSTTGIAQNGFAMAAAVPGGPIGGDRKGSSSWQATADG